MCSIDDAFRDSLRKACGAGTVNRVAKAMIHAMELCGGGVTKKELF
jgi:hypothetical protein